MNGQQVSPVYSEAGEVLDVGVREVFGPKSPKRPDLPREIASRTRALEFRSHQRSR